jgi:hypothetical protein
MDLTAGRYPVHHYFYGDPEKTDLQKMRDEANARALGTGLFLNRPGESSIIHHHKHGYNCDGQTHEYFQPGTGLVGKEKEGK